MRFLLGASLAVALVPAATGQTVILRKEFENRVVAVAELERRDDGLALRLVANMPVFRTKALERLNEAAGKALGDEFGRLAWVNYRFDHFRAEVDSVSFSRGAHPAEGLAIVSGSLVADQQRLVWKDLEDGFVWKAEHRRSVASFVAPFSVRLDVEGDGPIAGQTVVLAVEPSPLRATVNLKPFRGLVLEGFFTPEAPEPQRFPVADAEPPPLPLRLGDLRFAAVSDEEIVLEALLVSR